jgi:hypothetical protein
MDAGHPGIGEENRAVQMSSLVVDLEDGTVAADIAEDGAGMVAFDGGEACS